MDGVIRTRVGYAGGTTPDPTYSSIGNHSETIQVDYDPEVITYRDLLDVFWASHRPVSPAWSRQYASVIFTHDDEQFAAAQASKERIEAGVGTMYTEVRPLERFYVAEDYHQKYRLRNTHTLMDEFRSMFLSAAEFRDSTAAARVNGYLDGEGGLYELDAEVNSYGLTDEGAALLRAIVERHVSAR